MEKALMEFGAIPGPKFTVQEFVDWGREPRPYATQDRNDVFRMQRLLSAHLFRDRKAPLHHEYIVVSFGSHLVVESWIRLERAARLKERWWMPRTDSLGPLFGGATLRESVSFGTTMKSLSVGADEVATLSVAGDEKNYIPMTLSEFAEQVATLSASYPLYQLFTANCRWFARRIMLNLSLRHTSGAVCLWRSIPCSVDVIQVKLQAETFGGGLLDSSKDRLVPTVNLIHLAWTRAERPTEALKMCDDVINLINHAPIMNKASQLLAASTLATALRHKGILLRDQLDLPDQALPAHQKACEQLKALDSHEDLYLECLQNLADTFSALDRVDDAARTQQLCLSIWRRRKTNAETVHNIHGLASCSHNLGLTLRLIPGRISEAVTTTEESLLLHRKLHARLPRRYKSMFCHAMAAMTFTLEDAGSIREAYNLSREAVSLTRELVEEDQTWMHIHLALRLYRVSRLAGKLELWDEAYVAGHESTEHFRSLEEEEEDEHTRMFCQLLVHLGYCLVQLKRISDAKEVAGEGVERCRRLYASNPGLHRVRLVGALKLLAEIHELCGVDALALHREMREVM